MIDETAAEIRAMQTHSSSTVAIKAAEALREVPRTDHATVEEYRRSLERNAKALWRANPSHASLRTATRGIVTAVEDADPATVVDAKRATETAINGTVERIETGKHDAARNAADRLTDGTTLLTHDYSSTVIEALSMAAADGKSADVRVTEARPRHLGRKTARELADIEGIDPTLIVDSASGNYLDECDRVLVGMDCIVGDRLYNRVGTFPLCATADALDVPVSVVGSSAKIVDEGFVFENEHRAISEVIREPPTGFAVENPAYDATPLELIDAVVTDDGVR
ncbi:initiation factor 2B [Halobacteriales archaeon SW_7_68_16]|nr:MAG: initiation factor 2B [Halobacteriales archaeon SW_7_68_16]